jgi:hypothetical protein
MKMKRRQQLLELSVLVKWWAYQRQISWTDFEKARSILVELGYPEKNPGKTRGPVTVCSGRGDD